MKSYPLALIGFGNVGQAFVRLLLRKDEELRKRYQISFKITAIATGSRGRAIDLNGLDPEAALECIRTGDSLDRLSTKPAPFDTLEFIQSSGAKVLFENILGHGSVLTPVQHSMAVKRFRTADRANGAEATTAAKGRFRFFSIRVAIMTAGTSITGEKSKPPMKKSRLPAHVSTFMPDRTSRQEFDSPAPVPSPCVRNCCLDDDDICLGCFRSLDEITAWGSVDATRKQHIVEQAARRRKARDSYATDL